MKLTLILFGIALFLFLLVIGPVFTVWSIQILFRSETLELNFESWCAAAWLLMILNGLKIGVKKND